MVRAGAKPHAAFNNNKTTEKQQQQQKKGERNKKKKKKGVGREGPKVCLIILGICVSE